MTRNDINFNAVKLSKIYNNLLLEHCTGLGKTKSALDIVSKLPGNGYIVLSETSHKKNWYNEIIKHKHQDIFLRSEVFLYASLHKFKNTEIDWIIFDEIHNGFSDKRLEFIKSIKAKNRIFLTATLDKEQKVLLDTIVHDDIYRYKITLSQAIDNKILPTPEINLIPIELNNSSVSENIEIIRNKNSKHFRTYSYPARYSAMKKFPNDNLKITCTQSQKYNWLSEQMDYWKEKFFTERMIWQKYKWLNFGSQRKRFLAEIKTPYANYIALDLNRKNKRYICFTGSINQSEILGANNNVVHSKNKNNQKIIDNFNNKKISSIFAVNMLQEGVNLSDIEEGIIVQLDGKTRSYVQRAGRIFRSNKPIQHILYVKNTRDEEFLNNAMNGLEKYIKIHTHE